MNRALWRHVLGDARTPLFWCALLLFAFHWLFVWLTSYFDLGWLGSFLQFGVPEAIQRLVPLPAAQAATPEGLIALSYVDPVVIFTVAFWAFSRGSDAVSGPLDRGTLELTLAQPVSRTAWLAIHACVTTAGAAVLALCCWLGTAVGMTLVDLGTDASPGPYLFGAANLFCFTFCLAGVTTLISSCGRYRARTVGLVGGFFVVQLILKVVARMAPPMNWLLWLTIFGAYEPTAFFERHEAAWRLSLFYDGALLILGLATYLLAALIFRRRDLPAPL